MQASDPVMSIARRQVIEYELGWRLAASTALRAYRTVRAVQQIGRARAPDLFARVACRCTNASGVHVSERATSMYRRQMVGCEPGWRLAASSASRAYGTVRATPPIESMRAPGLFVRVADASFVCRRPRQRQHGFGRHSGCDARQTYMFRTMVSGDECACVCA